MNKFEENRPMYKFWQNFIKQSSITSKCKWINNNILKFNLKEKENYSFLRPRQLTQFHDRLFLISIFEDTVNSL